MAPKDKSSGDIRWQDIVSNNPDFRFAAFESPRRDQSTNSTILMRDTRLATRRQKLSLRAQQGVNTSANSESRKAFNAFRAAAADIESGRYSIDRINGDLYDSYETEIEDEFTIPEGDDVENLSSEEITLRGNRGIAHSILYSGNAQLRGMTELVSELIGVETRNTEAASKAIAASVTQGANIITNTLFMTNSKLDTINTSIQALVGFQNQNTAKYYEQTAGMINGLGKMFENFSKTLAPTTREERRFKPSRLKTLFSDYVNYVTSGLMETMLGSFGGTVAGAKELSTIAGDFGAGARSGSLLKNLLRTVGRSFLPRSITDRIDTARRDFQNLGDELFEQIADRLEMSKNPLLQSLAGVFGNKRAKINPLNMGAYSKDPIPWNGLSQKALTEVIPELLTQINTSINKGETENQYYDYSSGKFMSRSEIQKRYDNEYRDRINASMNPAIQKITEALESSGRNQSEQNTLFKEITALFDDAFAGGDIRKTQNAIRTKMDDFGIDKSIAQAVEREISSGIRNAIRQINDLNNDIQNTQSVYRNLSNKQDLPDLVEVKRAVHKAHNGGYDYRAFKRDPKDAIQKTQERLNIKDVDLTKDIELQQKVLNVLFTGYDENTENAMLEQLVQASFDKVAGRDSMVGKLLGGPRIRTITSGVAGAIERVDGGTTGKFLDYITGRTHEKVYRLADDATMEGMRRKLNQLRVKLARKPKPQPAEPPAPDTDKGPTLPTDNADEGFPDSDDGPPEDQPLGSGPSKKVSLGIQKILRRNSPFDRSSRLIGFGPGAASNYYTENRTSGKETASGNTAGRVEATVNGLPGPESITESAVRNADAVIDSAVNDLQKDQKSGDLKSTIINSANAVRTSMSAMVGKFIGWGSSVFGKNGLLGKLWNSDARKNLTEKLFTGENATFGPQFQAIKEWGKGIWDRTKEELAKGYDYVRESALKYKYGEDYEQNEKYQNNRFWSQFTNRDWIKEHMAQAHEKAEKRRAEREAAKAAEEEETPLGFGFGKDEKPPQMTSPISKASIFNVTIPPEKETETKRETTDPFATILERITELGNRKIEDDLETDKLGYGPTKVRRSTKRRAEREAAKAAEPEKPEAIPEEEMANDNEIPDANGVSKVKPTRKTRVVYVWSRNKETGRWRETTVRGTSKKFFKMSQDDIKEMVAKKTDVALDDIVSVTEEVVGGIRASAEALIGNFREDPETNRKKFTADFMSKLKTNLPKALAGGIVGAGIGALNLGNSGLLGAMLGPAGPIAGAIVGSGLSILSKTEAFQSIMFGKLNEETGQREGGLITEKMRERFKSLLPSVVGGAAVGALRGVVKGALGFNKGAGILGMQLLPGGILGGAVIGAGIGLLKNSEGFNNLLFGPKDADGKRSGTFLSNAYNKVRGMFAGGFKDAAFKGLAGAGVGALTGTVLSNMGFLPSMLSLGGPIGMGIAGLGFGIASASKRFNEYIFGSEYVGEDGKKHRREDGLLTKVRNLISINLVEPIGNAFKEKLADTVDWIKDKIADPFRLAFGPLADSFKQIGDDIREFAKERMESFGKALYNATFGLLQKLFQPFTKLIGNIGKLGISALSAGTRLVLSPVSALARGASMLMSKERRKEEKSFRRSFRDYLGSEEGQQALTDYYDIVEDGGKNRRNIIQRAMDRWDLRRGRGEFADAFRSGYNSQMEEEGLNHLDWRSVVMEKRDRKNARKDRRREDKNWNTKIFRARQDIINRDLRGNSGVTLSDEAVASYRDRFSKLGIDADWLQSSNDIMQLLYRPDEFRARMNGTFTDNKGEAIDGVTQAVNEAEEAQRLRDEKRDSFLNEIVARMGGEKAAIEDAKKKRDASITAHEERARAGLQNRFNKANLRGLDVNDPRFKAFDLERLDNQTIETFRASVQTGKGRFTRTNNEAFLKFLQQYHIDPIGGWTNLTGPVPEGINEVPDVNGTVTGENSATIDALETHQPSEPTPAQNASHTTPVRNRDVRRSFLSRFFRRNRPVAEPVPAEVTPTEPETAEIKIVDPREREERIRQMAQMYISEDKISFAEIGRRFGVSGQTVSRNLREKLPQIDEELFNQFDETLKERRSIKNQSLGKRVSYIDKFLEIYKEREGERLRQRDMFAQLGLTLPKFTKSYFDVLKERQDTNEVFSDIGLHVPSATNDDNPFGIIFPTRELNETEKEELVYFKEIRDLIHQILGNSDEQKKLTEEQRYLFEDIIENTEEQTELTAAVNGVDVGSTGKPKGAIRRWISRLFAKRQSDSEAEREAGEAPGAASGRGGLFGFLKRKKKDETEESEEGKKPSIFSRIFGGLKTTGTKAGSFILNGLKTAGVIGLLGTIGFTIADLVHPGTINTVSDKLKGALAYLKDENGGIGGIFTSIGSAIKSKLSNFWNNRLKPIWDDGKGGGILPTLQNWKTKLVEWLPTAAHNIAGWLTDNISLVTKTVGEVATEIAWPMAQIIWATVKGLATGIWDGVFKKGKTTEGISSSDAAMLESHGIHVDQRLVATTSSEEAARVAAVDAGVPNAEIRLNNETGEYEVINNVRRGSRVAATAEGRDTRVMNSQIGEAVTREGVKSVLFPTATKAGLKAGGKIALKAGKTATNIISKIPVIGFVGKIGKGALNVTEKAATTGANFVQKAISKVTGKAATEVIENTGEALAKSAITKFGEFIQKIAEDKLLKKATERLAQDSGASIIQKAVGLLQKLAGKAMEATGEKLVKIGNAITEGIAKIAGNTALIVTAIVTIGIGGIFGAIDAPNLFGIDRGNVDGVMTLVSSLMGAFLNIPWIGTLLDVAFTISAILGYNIKQELAIEFYKLLVKNDEEKIKKLEISQDQQEAERQIYNALNNTNLDKDAYNDVDNRTVFGSMWNGIKSIFGKGEVSTKKTSGRAYELLSQSGMSDADIIELTKDQDKLNSTLASLGYGPGAKISSLGYGPGTNTTTSAARVFWDRTQGLFNNSTSLIRDETADVKLGSLKSIDQTIKNIFSLLKAYTRMDVAHMDALNAPIPTAAVEMTNEPEKSLGYGKGDYDQGNSRWAKQTIGRNRDGSPATMETSGCGPTALAIAADKLGIGYGPGITPIQAARALGDTLAPDGATTTRTILSSGRLGMRATPVGDINGVARAARTNPVIVSGQGSAPFTNAGHLAVIDGIRGTSAHVTNPEGGGGAYFNLNSLRKNITSAFSMSRLGYGPSRAEREKAKRAQAGEDPREVAVAERKDIARRNKTPKSPAAKARAAKSEDMQTVGKTEPVALEWSKETNPYRATTITNPVREKIDDLQERINEYLSGEDLPEIGTPISKSDVNIEKETIGSNNGIELTDIMHPQTPEADFGLDESMSEGDAFVSLFQRLKSGIGEVFKKLTGFSASLFGFDLGDENDEEGAVLADYISPNDVDYTSNELTGNDRDRFLKAMHSQLGYLEKATNASLEKFKENPGNNNYTLYGKEFGANGSAWCANLMSWAAKAAGIPESVIPRSGSCTSIMQKAIKMKIFHYRGEYTPVPGDLVLFNWEGHTNARTSKDCDHIGVVEFVDSQFIHTIEGNTSDPKKSSGYQGVYQKTYRLNSNYIVGYVHPNWPKAESITVNPNELLSETRFGVRKPGSTEAPATPASGANTVTESTRTTELIGSSNAEKVWRYLRNVAGLSDFGAAGIMGNWQAESSINPKTVEAYWLPEFPGYDKMTSNKVINEFTKALFEKYKNQGLSISESAYLGSNGNYYPGMGLAQWTGPRGEKMFSYMKQHGLDMWALPSQLQFFKDEASADYKGLFDKLNKAASPADAAKRFLDGYEMYEGFADSHPTNFGIPRSENAAAFYKQFKDTPLGYGQGDKNAPIMESDGEADLLKALGIRDGMNVNVDSSSMVTVLTKIADLLVGVKQNQENAASSSDTNSKAVTATPSSVTVNENRIVNNITRQPSSHQSDPYRRTISNQHALLSYRQNVVRADKN